MISLNCLQRSLRDPNAFGGLIAVLFLSLAFAILVLPPHFIHGTSAFWLAQNQDITTYQAGFNAFFREPWHWPLLRIDSLNWPTGTLTTFVDIVPLYSALLKLILPQSWFSFNPFGFWILLCIVLQAIGGWWILREARVNSWIGLLAFTIFLLSSPSWLNRISTHTSLFSHFILLFAFALVLQEQRRQQFPLWSWSVLLLAAFFINLYLFFMIGLVFAVRWFIQIAKQPRQRLLISSGLIAAIFIIAIWAMMWPLPPNSGKPESGFGLYSLNLLSPFLGGAFSQFAPNSSSPEQAFEGLNYLGAGLLLLLSCVALSSTLGSFSITKSWLTQTHTTPVFLRSMWWLFFVFFIYAISNKVYFGTHLILQWGVPEWAQAITGQFRVSGRFFWLVAYGLIIVAVVATYRRYSRPFANTILILACAIQLFDLEPFFLNTQRQINRITTPIIDLEAWRARIPANVQTLYVYPKIKCNKKSSFFERQLPFTLLASNYQLNVSTGYIARYNPTCQNESKEIAASDFTKSAYIFVNAEYEDSAIHSYFPPQINLECQKISEFTLCTVNP
jgi:hypothetical protein